MLPQAIIAYSYVLSDSKQIDSAGVWGGAAAPYPSRIYLLDKPMRIEYTTRHT
jgi:hypothetical protein